MNNYTPPKVETLELSHSCKLEITHWNGKVDCELINMFDHYPDETIDIDKETASAIIASLSKFVEEKK